MAIRERLIYAIDLVTDGANKGLANFRTAVGQAETTTGKFKAGANAAFESIKANAGAFGVAAGAALVTYGAKAVAASQDLALSAGKFSDATKLNVEDASRWMEISGDLGISTETIRGAFVRMNKALADGSPLADKYGISLQRTADGAVDVNATMIGAISTLSRIADPTERAAAAQALFGRNYAEMSELIFNGSEKVVESLEAVSNAKVIDEQELAQARRFRDAMDSLEDSVQDITLTLGQGLVPVLANVAEGVSEVDNAIDDIIPGASGLGKVLGDGLTTAIEGPAGLFKKIAGGADDAGESIEKLTGITEQASTRSQDLVQSSIESAHTYRDLAEAADIYGEVAAANRQAIEDETEAQRELEEAQARALAVIQRLTDEYNDQKRAADSLKSAKLQLVGGEIGVREAQRQARDVAEELGDELGDLERGTDDYQAALDDAVSAQLNAAQTSANYRAEQMRANGSTVDAATEARLMAEELYALAGTLNGPLQEALLAYIQQLLAIPKEISTTLSLKGGGGVTGLSVNATSGSGAGISGTGNSGVRGIGAEGAVVNRPTVALIGEAGPEALVPLDKLPGNGPIESMLGGGGSTYNITVHAGIQASGPEISRLVVEAIKKYERGNGPGWRT